MGTMIEKVILRGTDLTLRLKISAAGFDFRSSLWSADFLVNGISRCLMTQDEAIYDEEEEVVYLAVNTSEWPNGDLYVHVTEEVDDMYHTDDGGRKELALVDMHRRIMGC